MSNNSPPTEFSELATNNVLQLSKAARQLFRQKKFDQARELYAQGLSADATNPYLLSGMGDVCREAGDFAEAQRTYQRLLDVEPENLYALRGMGDSLKAQGQLADAIQHWAHYLNLRSGDVHVMTRLADAFKQLEQFAQAEGLYREILQTDSMDSYALSGLADLLHRSGRDHEAISCYEKILTLRHDALHILTIVGKLCWRVSDFDKAKHFFLKALDIDPDNPYALYGLGNCYRWQREYAKAVEVWQRILVHSEGTITLYSRLGDAFTHLGDFSSAEQAYRQVLDKGYDRFAQIGLIKLLCDQNNFEHAIEEFNTLLGHEKDPWKQLDELSRRFVQTGRRAAMIRFYNLLLAAAVPNCIEPERLKDLLKKLEG